jgi:hypothetical protein
MIRARRYTVQYNIRSSFCGPLTREAVASRLHSAVLFGRPSAPSWLHGAMSSIKCEVRLLMLLLVLDLSLHYTSSSSTVEAIGLSAHYGLFSQRAPFSLYVCLVEEEWNAAAPEANIRFIFGTRALPKICQTDGSRARALLSSRQLRASNSVSLTAQAHLHLVASASGSPPARGLPVLSSSPPSRAPL